MKLFFTKKVLILFAVLISLLFTRCKDREIELDGEGNFVKSIWVAPAEQKIRPDAQIEKNNLRASLKLSPLTG